jgi:hypothetical protein
VTLRVLVHRRWRDPNDAGRLREPHGLSRGNPASAQLGNLRPRGFKQLAQGGYLAL